MFFKISVKSLIGFYILTLSTVYNAIADNEFSKLAFTVPGTKWCGPGNIAKNISDLGIFAEEDKCCRDHDHCQKYILKGDTKFNLENTDSFTRFNCACETNFLKCLRKVNSGISKTVGYFYTLFARYCFSFQHPIKKCIMHQESRCTKYKVNKNKPKQWQWFEIPIFDEK